MPAIPVPFITTMLLVMFLMQLLNRQNPQLRPGIGFTAACVMMVLLVGLRWSGDFPALRYLQPLVASLLPLIAWRCFYSLTGKNSRLVRMMMFIIPAVALLLILKPVPFFSLDLYIALLFAGYGIALFRLASVGSDSFSLSRLTATPTMQKAARVAGGALCFSALIDLLIMLDFTLYAGRHAATVVATGQLLLTGVLATVIVIAGRSQPAIADLPAMEKGKEEGTDGPDEDRDICRQVEVILLDKQLYCDPDLTLERLARKIGIPAKKISRAVNRVQGHNVSQMINGYRIAQAQRLLLTTRLTVTEIMLESGFRTKSNFNREFLRISNMNPGAYRKAGHSDNRQDVSTAIASELKTP